jgi:hypothetical protein
MSPVPATLDRSSMNGGVEYRALNVGFVPTNIADRMPAVSRDTPLAIGNYSRSAFDLGCVKTSASVSPAREIGHLRAVLTHLGNLRGRLKHAPEHEILAR